ATLTLTDVQPQQAGDYAVVVSNTAGSITSSNATLTVNPPPACAEPPYGLVGWWPFDGDTVDRVFGASGVIVGHPAFTNGLIGQAMFFNGNGDAVRVPASAALDIGAYDGLTIEAWINCTTLSRLEPIF